MSEAIEKRLHELREMAKRYAEAKASADYLDHYRKSKLAILMRVYGERGFSTTAAQDREARADSEYLEVLGGLRAATEEAERLGWELRIAMKGADLWQTQQANRRHEMGQYRSVT